MNGHGHKKTGESKSKSKGKENQDTTLQHTNGHELHQPKLVFYTEPYKLGNDEQTFERLVDAVVAQFTNMSTIYWVPMVESAIQCVFKLADRPIVIVESMIQRLMDKLPVMKALMSTSVEQLPSDEDLVCSYELLARFINMIGMVATKFLVFMNQMVVCELKRRKMCKEKKSNIVRAFSIY